MRHVSKQPPFVASLLFFVAFIIIFMFFRKVAGQAELEARQWATAERQRLKDARATKAAAQQVHKEQKRKVSAYCTCTSKEASFNQTSAL
jgi:hypothetical protein